MTSVLTQRVCAIAEAPNEKLWVGAVGGLFEFSLEHKKIVRAFFTDHSSLSSASIDLTIFGLLLDRKQNLWMGSVYGAWRLEPSDAAPVPLAGEWFGSNSRFAEDVNGDVWASSQGEVVPQTRGLAVFRSATKEPETILLDQALGGTMCVSVDREGTVWAGGMGGLFRARRQPFATVTFAPAPSAMRSVSVDPTGTLWFGYAYYFGRWSGRQVTLFDVRSLFGWLTPSRWLPSIAPGTDDRVWANWREGGLFHLPISPNAEVDFPPATQLYPHIGEVRAMAGVHESDLWMATTNGLFHLSPVTGLRRIEAVPHADIEVLLLDRRSDLWIGTIRRGAASTGGAVTRGNRAD